jgi:hypothetical protein
MHYFKPEEVLGQKIIKVIHSPNEGRYACANLKMQNKIHKTIQTLHNVTY